MLLLRVQFMLLTTLLQTGDAFHRNPPTTGDLLLPQVPSRERSVLARREETCADGGRCLVGSCCGAGCAANCCAHDDGGVGCGVAERCDFDGNVFIGCCSIAAIGGCTGTATSIYVTEPFSTITLSTDGPLTTFQYTPTSEDSTTSSLSFPTYDSLSYYSTPTSSQEYLPSITSPAYDDGESSGHGRLSTGAKAGIGVGASVGGLALVAVAGFFFKRNRSKNAATGALAYTPAPPAPMTEDKGQMMSGKATDAPAYPTHASELSGASEVRRYEMPG